MAVEPEYVDNNGERNENAKIWPVCCSVGIIFLTTLTAFAQLDQQSAMSQPCVTSVGAGLDELEREKLALEQAVAASKLRAETLAATPGSDASEPLKRAKQELEANQASLIDTLYRMECFRPDLQRTEEVVRGSEAALTMDLVLRDQPARQRRAA